MSEERSIERTRIEQDEVTDVSFEATTSSGEKSETPTSQLPQLIGRYQVESMLGQGGFGAVYLAFDEKLDRFVAIKVPHRELAPARIGAEFYLAEARTVASLDHPNIVPVYDCGSSDEFAWYIVMKYVKGANLHQLMKELSGGRNFSEAARLIATLASALHYAHKQGLVHRDLKPGNILVDDNQHPWIVDFGLALHERDLGKGPRFAGTDIYMSPEQARGEGHRVDGRSDIYSLGTILFELLTGRRVVSAKSKSEILDQVQFQDVRPLRQIDDTIPRELERICMKALAKRASERYTTASDMAEDLQHFLETDRGNTSSRGLTSQSVLEPRSTPASVDSPRTPIDSSPESQPVCVIPKGLRSFDSHDSEFFLSLLPGPRDREGIPDSLRFWKQKLEQRDEESTFPVGLMYGPSGCGKSSLVRAGLIPILAPDVIPILVEASAEQTAQDVLRQCRNRWPSIEATRLSEMLSALRRGEGPSLGRKVVVILDQFEQWLNTANDYTRSELVQSLRQCDGGRVQCLLLVRDDFWLPVSRFMRSLEVKLIEGHNSGLVDLFDRDHALRVLAAFGRAYGRLPESWRQTTKDQRDFLSAAVESIADQGKVISVRLALFAEMMKDRPWTSASLESIGGEQGIGVAFLEHTFSAGSAPPEHRLHQTAACAVLKSLLPDVGVDIKGEMKSFDTLKEISGYANRPEDFQDLIRILDSEVRLIAPTDPSSHSGARMDATSVRVEGQYYQLTHDYLVQPLREWLTSKQKTTRRGRAELLLAEREATWRHQRDNRLLPSLWEWGSIHALTHRRDWSSSQRAMMTQKDRFVVSRAIGLLVCLVLLTAAAWETQGRRQAQSLLETLVHAPTRAVPSILEDATAYRRWLDRKLSDRLEQEVSEPQRLHLQLAATPYDPQESKALVEHALGATPEEISVIRACMASEGKTLAGDLWRIVKSTDVDASKQLRGACMLAAFDPDGVQWDDVSKQVLVTLEAESALLSREWVDLLRPARSRLLPALASLIAESRAVGEQRPMSELYVEFAHDIPDAFAPLIDLLQEHPAVDRNSRVQSARRRSNVAATLAVAGKWEEVLPLLASSPDPTLRTLLIERLGSNDCLGPELANLVDLESEVESSIRQAIVIALGDLANDRTSARMRQAWVPILRRWEHEDRVVGVQSAVRWTLGRWGIDERGASASTSSLTQSGPAAQELVRSVRIEPGNVLCRQEGKEPYTVQVDRPFEIAITEVSIVEYLRFRSDHAWDQRAANTTDCPVHEVSWFDAAAYCNWLSEQAKLDRSEWCYIPNADGNYADGMVIPANVTERKGYRLPTANEWEFACRNGCTTYWSVGEDIEMLDRYAWSLSNSGIHSHPVASLRPSDLGLFDMHGNVWEWCHDVVDQHGHMVPIGISEGHVVTNDTYLAMRGGTYLTDPESLGSSFGNWNVAAKRTNADGFRVVRTCPVPSETQE